MSLLAKIELSLKAPDEWDDKQDVRACDTLLNEAIAEQVRDFAVNLIGTFKALEGVVVKLED